MEHILAYNIPRSKFDKESLSDGEISTLKMLLDYYRNRAAVVDIIRERAICIELAKSNGFPYPFDIETAIIARTEIHDILLEIGEW